MFTKRGIAFLLAALFLLVNHPVAAAADRPNIVLFYIDDLGWTDVGYTRDLLDLQPERFYETPHIDALARESLVFLDAYANASVCMPSRACLMTGLYGPRHGVYSVGNARSFLDDAARMLEPIENARELADEFVTIAEVLQQNGYATASIGKWHLGEDPTTQGFDVNVAGNDWGSPESGGGYHSPFDYPHLTVPEPGAYLTDELTGQAVEFITQHQGESFFLYLSHFAVHIPIEAKTNVVAYYEAKDPADPPLRPGYAAMLQSVDESVAHVLETLQDLDLARNTMIIFTSDNGGYTERTSNYPLRGGKGSLYEGGIRVPMFIRWPGVTSAGGVCRVPVIGLDLFPSLLEITSTPTPDESELDGVSLVPLLENPHHVPDRRALFWHFPCYLGGYAMTPAAAVRLGGWKLIEWFETGEQELYHLADDLGETTNLAASHPEKLKELESVMEDWRDQVNASVPTTLNPTYDPFYDPRPAGKFELGTRGTILVIALLVMGGVCVRHARSRRTGSKH